MAEIITIDIEKIWSSLFTCNLKQRKDKKKVTKSICRSVNVKTNLKLN